jgi:hypothetical protein
MVSIIRRIGLNFLFACKSRSSDFNYNIINFCDIDVPHVYCCSHLVVCSTSIICSMFSEKEKGSTFGTKTFLRCFKLHRFDSSLFFVGLFRTLLTNRWKSLSKHGNVSQILCRYPEDRILPRTSSKSRQKTRWVYMPACPTAPVSWHRAAPEPPRASWLQLPPPGPAAAPGPPRASWPLLSSPGTGQLQDCHVPHGSSSCHQGQQQLWDRHVPCGPGPHLLSQDSSGTATCPQGSSSRLLAQDSSKATMCPMGRSCELLK